MSDTESNADLHLSIVNALLANAGIPQSCKALNPSFPQPKQNFNSCEGNRRQGDATVSPMTVTSNPRKRKKEDTPDEALSKKVSCNRGQFLEKQWEELYARLIEYKEKNGHCLVPNRYKEDKQLGLWVSTQRRNYRVKNPTLTSARIARLEEIGFAWHGLYKHPQASWSQRYGELCDFKEVHGHCLVPLNYPANRSLSDWVSSQRHEYQNYKTKAATKLTSERIHLLNEKGFVWDVTNVHLKKSLGEKVVSSDTIPSSTPPTQAVKIVPNDVTTSAALPLNQLLQQQPSHPLEKPARSACEEIHFDKRKRHSGKMRRKREQETQEQGTEEQQQVGGQSTKQVHHIIPAVNKYTFSLPTNVKPVPAASCSISSTALLHHNMIPTYQPFITTAPMIGMTPHAVVPAHFPPHAVVVFPTVMAAGQMAPGLYYQPSPSSYPMRVSPQPLMVNSDNKIPNRR